MRPRKPQPTPEARAKIMAEVRRNREIRQQGYREQALKLFPHVCGRCGREFSGANLRELTVHHKDHDHHNNPPDGSNWELLCLYCHDDVHQKTAASDYHRGTLSHTQDQIPLGDNPFRKLKEILEENKD